MAVIVLPPSTNLFERLHRCLQISSFTCLLISRDPAVLRSICALVPINLTRASMALILTRAVPTDKQLLAALRVVRTAQPILGFKKTVTEIHRAHPNWEFAKPVCRARRIFRSWTDLLTPWGLRELQRSFQSQNGRVAEDPENHVDHNTKFG